MKYPAIFAIAVGILMALQWAFFLTAGQVPELQTAPWEIAHHLAAELMTAVTLVGGGIGLLGRVRWAKTVTLLGLGMVIYSSVNSSGYFSQSGQWAFTGMFAVLLVLAAAAAWRLLRAGDSAG